MSSTSDRVRQLIQSSGQTQREFAHNVGLDESKLSKSLAGRRRFSSLDLARIAELGSATVDWLITGEDTPLATAARTTGGSAGTAVEQAWRLSTFRADLATLGFAQPWRPLEVAPAGGRAVDEGAQLARAAGARLSDGDGWRTNPVEAIEQAFGADVAVADLGDGFDGLATSSDEVKLIVLATSHLPARQRFTLAHELGHLLAGDDQGVHLDEDVYAKTDDLTEVRANAFAAAFLMPEDVLRSAVGSQGLTNDSFAALSCDLVVSPSALAFRLSKLRLIDSGTCDRLRSMSASTAAQRAGRGEELARRTAEAGRPRPPGLLARDTYAAYAAGSATLRPYANLIGANVDALRRDLESTEASTIS